MALRWRDVDVLTGLITVTRSKNDRSRQVPINSVARSILMDLAGKRARPNEASDIDVFWRRGGRSTIAFSRSFSARRGERDRGYA
jgi:integrase